MSLLCRVVGRRQLESTTPHFNAKYKCLLPKLWSHEKRSIHRRFSIRLFKRLHKCVGCKDQNPFDLSLLLHILLIALLIFFFFTFSFILKEIVCCIFPSPSTFVLGVHWSFKRIFSALGKIFNIVAINHNYIFALMFSIILAWIKIISVIGLFSFRLCPCPPNLFVQGFKISKFLNYFT